MPPTKRPVLQAKRSVQPILRALASDYLQRESLCVLTEYVFAGKTVNVFGVFSYSKLIAIEITRIVPKYRVPI